MEWLSYFKWPRSKKSEPQLQPDLPFLRHKSSVDNVTVACEVLPPGSPVIFKKLPGSPLKAGKSELEIDKSKACKSFAVDYEPLLEDQRRPNCCNPDEISYKIIDNSQKVADKIRLEKEKREAQMILQVTPSIDVEDWDDDMIEIHKYVEHNQDLLRSECYYCTKLGKIKGMLTIKDGIIVFDPLKCDENSRIYDICNYH